MEDQVIEVPGLTFAEAAEGARRWCDLMEGAFVIEQTDCSDCTATLHGQLEREQRVCVLCRRREAGELPNRDWEAVIEQLRYEGLVKSGS